MWRKAAATVSPQARAKSCPPKQWLQGVVWPLGTGRLAGLNSPAWSKASSLLIGYSQLQQQAWAPKSSIFCPHCWLSVQRDSKVVVLEISLKGLICSNLRPIQARYVERHKLGSGFCSDAGHVQSLPLRKLKAEVEADARQVLGLQLISSVDTGWANSHQPFWQW